MTFNTSLEGVRNPQLQRTLEARFDEIGNINTTLAAAVAGDLIFSISPATVDAEIVAQNVGVSQVVTGTVSGEVASDGAGDITVTVTADGMSNSPVDVTVTLANSDAATDIAGKIQTALAADTDVSNSGSGFWVVTNDGATVILTLNDEAANDTTASMTLSLPDTGEATAATGSEFALASEITTAGVAPYTRDVVCKLVDTDGNTHTWYTDDVAMTIAETTAGDGAATMAGTDKTGSAVTGDDNYGFVNGECTVTVTLKGTWAAVDTNTVTISQKTILGSTVTAKTSVETSIDT